MSTAVVEEERREPESASGPALKLLRPATDVDEQARKAAWDLVLDNRGLVGLVQREMTAGSAMKGSLVEAIDRFQDAGEDALFRAALKYNQGSVRSKFSTYATSALKNTWHEVLRQIQAERGTGPRRGRSDAPASRQAEQKKPGFEEGSLTGQHLDDPDFQEALRTGRKIAQADAAAMGSWHRRDVESMGRRKTRLYRQQGWASRQARQAAQAAGEGTSKRQEREIHQLIYATLGLFLRDAPNLTPREAEAVSFYLWGEGLAMARAFWKLDDFHSMTTLLLAEGQLLTRKEIAGLMSPSPWGGKPHPVSRQSVNTWLTQAARKLGVSAPESLRYKAILGLMAWELRIKVMKRQGRYQPRPNLFELSDFDFGDAVDPASGLEAPEKLDLAEKTESRSQLVCAY